MTSPDCPIKEDAAGYICNEVLLCFVNAQSLRADGGTCDLHACHVKLFCVNALSCFPSICWF